MDIIISAITAWKDLIVEVFSQYTLAAALVTLAAIGCFFYLEQQLRPRQAPTNILIVLLGWAILVPIVGFVLTILSKIWAFIEAVMPQVAKLLGSFYSIYDKHPFLVLSLILVAFVTYFVWRRWWPAVLPARALRILSLATAVVLAAHIANPIANALVPASSPERPATNPIVDSQPSAAKLTAVMPTAVTPEPSLQASPASPSPTASPTPAPPQVSSSSASVVPTSSSPRDRQPVIKPSNCEYVGGQPGIC
jgi:hypothetical protein